jgi:DNA invertase Pin-like site-specific DNA recombinase
MTVRITATRPATRQRTGTPRGSAPGRSAEVVLGYVRSVSDRPAFMTGCKAALATWCAKNGWELRVVFTDVCSGLDVEDRPGFQGLLDALGNHQAAVVVLVDGGHLSHEVEVVEELSTLVALRGAELRVMDGGLPPSTAQNLVRQTRR